MGPRIIIWIRDYLEGIRGRGGMMEKRKQQCPEHFSQYLCRQNDKIICCGRRKEDDELCSWEVEIKRTQDLEIPTGDDWN